VNVNCVEPAICGVVRGRSHHNARSEAASRPATAPAAISGLPAPAASDPGHGRPVGFVGPASLPASRAKATSRTDWKRSSGRFSRQRFTTRSNTEGTAGFTSSGGSSLRIAVITSGEVCPENARRPESIS
jgi:hypothetical protein